MKWTPGEDRRKKPNETWMARRWPGVRERREEANETRTKPTLEGEKS